MNRVVYDAETGDISWGDHKVIKGKKIQSKPTGPVRVTLPTPSIPGNYVAISNGNGGWDWVDPESITHMDPKVREEIAQLRLELNNQTERFWKEAEFIHNRISDTETLVFGPSYDDSEVCGRVEELEKEVDALASLVLELQESKIDKPSANPDLVAAEIYMDDFMEVRKRFAKQRFAAKKRVERKLARIQKAAEFKQSKARNRTRSRMLAALGTLGTVVALAIILL